MREYKAIISTNIKAESSGRVRTGIAAVFGNVDSTGDRIMPGAFIRTINNGSKRVKHLWNHSWEHPPIAKIVELREVSAKELPAEVLEKSPEATGGLLVKREYYDNELSNWILQAIDADDVNEMSFAFDVVRSENVTHEDDTGGKSVVRELLEMSLFDTSDVLWGVNSATIAIGAKAHFGSFQAGAVPAGIVANQLALIRDECKAGRCDVKADAELFKFIHDTAIELGAVCNNPDHEQSAKGEPEPAISDSTSLLLRQNRARLNSLKLFRSHLGEKNEQITSNTSG